MGRWDLSRRLQQTYKVVLLDEPLSNVVFKFNLRAPLRLGSNAFFWAFQVGLCLALSGLAGRCTLNPGCSRLLVLALEAKII
jgi:hypothetical protein